MKSELAVILLKNGKRNTIVYPGKQYKAIVNENEMILYEDIEFIWEVTI